MSNTWVICRKAGDNLLKSELIPNVDFGRHLLESKGGVTCRFMISPRPISLLVR